MVGADRKGAKVEELAHFPFKNFKDFRAAYIQGIIAPGVDRSAALNWALGGGLHAPSTLRFRLFVLSWVPFIALLGFPIYVIATKNWLWLLAFPVLLIGYFLFHPSAAMVFGVFRTLAIFLTFIALVWAYWAEKWPLLVLAIALTLIWYEHRSVYRSAVSSLIAAAVQHEDLLCLLWQGKAVNVRFHNGDEYWPDWKVEGGQSTHYR
jgi:hypothetical protein